MPAELLLAAHERRCAPVHWCLCVFCTCMHEIFFHLCFESWSGRTGQRLQGRDYQSHMYGTDESKHKSQLVFYRESLTRQHWTHGCYTYGAQLCHNYYLCPTIWKHFSNTTWTQSISDYKKNLIFTFPLPPLVFSRSYIFLPVVPQTHSVLPSATVAVSL